MDAEELSLPPARTEAIGRRLALALDAQNWPAYRATLGEVLGCEHCTAELIGTLVSTMVLLFNRFEPNWKEETADRLTELLYNLHGGTATDHAILALLEEEDHGDHSAS